jgi:hypothetical protein
VGPREYLEALEQMKVLPLPSTKPRFLGHPACRNKYRATEIVYEKSKIMNRKGNLALRRVDGTAAVTIGIVKWYSCSNDRYCKIISSSSSNSSSSGSSQIIPPLKVS